MDLYRVICVDTFEAANDPEAAQGYEAFSSTDETVAIQWAKEKLAQLEETQPSETSGGQAPHGIQDRVFIENPDRTRYRIVLRADNFELPTQYLEDVETAGCNAPRCTHDDHGMLYMPGRCHPGAGTRVVYTKGTGFIEVACHKCGEWIANIAVASRSHVH
jgi:hypothetical protein